MYSPNESSNFWCKSRQNISWTRGSKLSLLPSLPPPFPSYHQSFLWESNKIYRLSSPEKCTHTPAPQILHAIHITGDSQNARNPARTSMLRNPALGWSSQFWSLSSDPHQQEDCWLTQEWCNVQGQSGQGEVLAELKSILVHYFRPSRRCHLH